ATSLRRQASGASSRRPATSSDHFGRAYVSETASVELIPRPPWTGGFLARASVSFCQQRRRAGALLEPRRGQRHVGHAPHRLLLVAHLRRLVVTPLRVQRLREVEQGPAVGAIGLQALAIHGLRRRRLPGLE